MSELLGIAKMRSRLNLKKTRVDTRYKYYEMKNIIKDFNISTPPELRNFQTVLGWCGKSVDSISDRLMFREFEEDNFDINEIFLMNNPDTFFDSAILLLIRVYFRRGRISEVGSDRRKKCNWSYGSNHGDVKRRVCGAGKK